MFQWAKTFQSLVSASSPRSSGDPSMARDGRGQGTEEDGRQPMVIGRDMEGKCERDRRSMGGR
jgi:hypothetical protein